MSIAGGEIAWLVICLILAALCVVWARWEVKNDNSEDAIIAGFVAILLGFFAVVGFLMGGANRAERIEIAGELQHQGYEVIHVSAAFGEATVRRDQIINWCEIEKVLDKWTLRDCTKEG